MKNIGIFTVGGSTEPIINAIKEKNFDFIYFICSSGRKEAASERLVDGLPVKENEKIIVKECNLKAETYEKILINVDMIDDLNETCREIERQLLSSLNTRFPDKRSLSIIANFTGGTKTMSVALVFLSLLYNWQLQLNAGQRVNTFKIDSGDFPVAINKTILTYKMDRVYFNTLMQKYYYEEIIEKAKSYLSESSIPYEIKQEIMIIRSILNGFVLWDKFYHWGALEEFEKILKSVQKESSVHNCILPYALWLKQLLGLKKPYHGYEGVIDLLMNAERRTVQERYDDAIARYYRAIEMIAQLRLKIQYGIENSNIRCDALPSIPEKALQFLKTECEKNSENGTVKLALVKSYELLAHMDDILGNLYKERKDELLNCLTLRNSSILAHGLEPILKEKFELVRNTFKNFISDALLKIGVKESNTSLQFPESLKDIGL